MYMAALDWISNNHTQVDSVKPSEINEARRTALWLSSALRWGTTEHLSVSPEQNLPFWKAGDHELNIGALAAREMEHVLATVPDVKHWTFKLDPETDTWRFFDRNGPVMAEDGGWMRYIRDPARNGVGVSTLRRGAFSRALDRGEAFKTDAAGASHGFLEVEASSGLGRLGDMGESLYSQKEAEPLNPEAEKFAGAFAPALQAAGAALERARGESEVLYSQASQADEIAKALKAGTTGTKALELVSTAAGRKL